MLSKKASSENYKSLEANTREFVERVALVSISSALIHQDLSIEGDTRIFDSIQVNWTTLKFQYAVETGGTQYLLFFGPLNGLK